jgi:hypothetical protein
MVNSVNGNRGSSVVPIGGDDWMYMGRGRHVWLDNSEVHLNGSSGSTLADGITASGVSKVNQIRNTANTMKALLLKEMATEGDYVLVYGGPEI